jgi:DNA-directed RNA polymerase subunit M/transcription elongation factor TFIIS
MATRHKTRTFLSDSGKKESINHTLRNAVLKDGTTLSDSEITELINLQWPDGSRFLTVERRENIIDVITILSEMDSIGDAISYFKEAVNRCTSFRQLFFESPIFHAEKMSYIADTQRLRDGIKAGAGVYICPKCKSDNTNHYERLQRSADEPMNVYANCNDCTHRWRAR